MIGAARQVVLSKFNPKRLFAAGEKGVILLPENSDVAVGSGVGTLTDTSGNGKNATQATAANKPILRQNATTGALYLEFDGSGDWLQTAAIDLTGTDKVTVFAAVRKLSDAAQGHITEFGNTSSSVNGAFRLTGPDGPSASYGWRSKGTTAANPSYTNAAIAAPVSSVLCAVGDIAGANAVLRVNGAQVASVVTTQGTGAFGNHALYMGRRGDSSSPFNGHLYGLIIVGRTCTAAEISAVETFLNKRIGAY